VEAAEVQNGILPPGLAAREHNSSGANHRAFRSFLPAAVSDLYDIFSEYPYSMCSMEV